VITKLRYTSILLPGDEGKKQEQLSISSVIFHYSMVDADWVFSL